MLGMAEICRQVRMFVTTYVVEGSIATQRTSLKIA